MKKIGKFAAICVLLMLLTSLLVSCNGYDTGFYIKKMNTVAHVALDGSMTVSETWTVHIDDEEGYRNLYREIGLYDESFPSVLSSLSDFSVYDEDNGIEYTRDDTIDPNSSFDRNKAEPAT